MSRPSIELIQESLRELLQTGGDLAPVGERIRAAVVARREQRGEHAAWGRLCEEAGLWQLAFTEFQLALRDDPDDRDAVLRLARLYRERGDAPRAQALLARRLEADPSDLEALEPLVELLREEGAEPQVEGWLQRAEQRGVPAERLRRFRRARPATPAETGEGGDESSASEADCIRFQTLFSGREGVYARQWVKPGGEGGYSPIHEPLTPAVVRRHLQGVHTVGTYVLRVDETATFFALDLDIDRLALQQARADHRFAAELRGALQAAAGRLLVDLKSLGFAPLFENSGYKGRHYWVFLERPEPGEVLHVLGRRLLAWQAPRLPPGLHLEFFPKQSTLSGKGLGNLIKLPLGVHRRTGYRSRLLDDEGRPLADPFGALHGAARLSRERLYAAAERLKEIAPSAGAEPAERAGVRAERRKQEQGEAPPWNEAESSKGPAPPARPPAWSEADFEADPRIRHLLAHCPVLTEIKRRVEEHRRLSREEQLVLIHSLGHLEGGPQAVNYLFRQCVDVGPEKYMQDRLKGNPVSCPTIRKKIPQITRRVDCHCPFEFAADRYPTPVLHLLTLQETRPAPAAPLADLESLARRFAVSERRRKTVEAEWRELRDAFASALAAAPGRSVELDGGRYVWEEDEGVGEIRWEASAESLAPCEGVGGNPNAGAPAAGEVRGEVESLDS